MKLLKLERLGNGSPRSTGNPYCKQVIKLADDGFFVTIPMKFNRDYSQANSVGTRGVYDYYVLKPGRLYEIQEILSWKRMRRYYLFLHSNGDETTMTYEEAIECLSNGLISMC